MRAATLLIVLLSHDGYWFGDRAGELRFEPAPHAPAGRVAWDLMYGQVRVGGGAVDVAPGRVAGIRVTPPAVRSRTKLSVVYTFSDAAGKALESGEAAIHVFPDDVFGEAARVLDGRRLAVWGTRDDPLAAFLSRSKVPHTAATDVELRLDRPDVILFGPGTLDALDPLVRPPLEQMARRGASVVVFRQETCARLNGYRLARRTAPAKLAWRGDHPLLASFADEDLASLSPPGSLQSAIRMPADEPALELGWWPPEVPSEQPGPIDALLVTKSVGGGRLVLCQLPVGGEWATDVRGQMLLRAALEYAAIPPGPTPRPSERARPVPVGDENRAARRPHEERDILAPRGN